MVIRSSFNSKNGGVGCLIFGILGLIALFFVLRSLYILLAWASPVLLILAIIINWRAVADSGSSLWGLIQRSPLAGLIMIGLCVLGFPIVALYLLLKALGYQQVQKMRDNFETQFGDKSTPEAELIDFEEIDSRPGNAATEDTPLDTPPASAKLPDEQPKNPYDDFFKDKP